MRLRSTSCRHGDFQTKFLKIGKSRNYKQLILFQFLRLFLVSVENIWKYLTLTGTIWAQSNLRMLGIIKSNDIWWNISDLNG
jgi:hypothetical protein